MSMIDTVDLPAALHHYFGFDSFRPGQEEIVRRAVEGRDTLALMPTGSGKSLTYQLAAMLRPTPTVIVSPLIALMQDQIDNLPPTLASAATFINSSLDSAEVSRRTRGLATGEYRMVYVAPERLRQRQFVQILREAGVGLMVIDEVHCLSMWGHDFRPDYLFIRSALQALGDPPVLGLTATATQDTVEDIASALGRTPDVVRSSVERDNLRYEVKEVDGEEARLRTALAAVQALPGSGIIYARAKEKCEIIARMLHQRGISALHYHAGLEPGERTAVQQRFLTGQTRVIVATTAFGMGIDKPDIRWVLLYNFPDSLEDYVQRVGRAGRDGDLSLCVLFNSPKDATALRRFATSDLPTIQQLRALYRALQDRAVDGTTRVWPDDLTEAVGLERKGAAVLVGMLERAGLVRRDFDSGGAMCVEMLPPPADTPRRIDTLLGRYQQQALQRAEAMIGFAQTDRCRHQQVAEHFGESVRVPCGMCDVCAPRHSSAEQEVVERPLPDDIAGAILDTVTGLNWPMGQTGLAATLKGSVKTSPSGRRSEHFGILSAATESTIKRWITLLVEAGNLEFYQDGEYRLLRLLTRDDVPVIPAPVPARSSKKGAGRTAKPSSQARLAPEDQELFERLRAWRTERARDAGVPAYVVMQNDTLQTIAQSRPRDSRALTFINGLGPARIERYGADILALVSKASTTPS